LISQVGFLAFSIQQISYFDDHFIYEKLFGSQAVSMNIKSPIYSRQIHPTITTTTT
jgi:hypothetical protein